VEASRSLAENCVGIFQALPANNNGNWLPSQPVLNNLLLSLHACFRRSAMTHAVTADRREVPSALMLKSRSQPPQRGSQQQADSTTHTRPEEISGPFPTGTFFGQAWPWITIVLLTAIAYSNSLYAPFLFDDNSSIVDNESIRNLADLPTVFRALKDGHTVQGRPLLNLTLASNYAIHGAWPPGFRLVNIMLHAASGLLLFALVRETLRHGRHNEPLRPDATAIAFAAAAIWSLHPLNTESVTYIIQRAESLVAFWFLLTLTLFAFWLRLGRTSLLVGALVSSLAGMASKEVMITVPFAALLYDRTFVAASWQELFAKRWRAHGLIWLTTGLLFWILFSDSGNRGTTAGFGMGMSPWHYFLTSIDACATYLKLAFWPEPLVFDYGTDLVKDPTTIVPQTLVVFGVAIGGLVVGWRRPWIGFLTLVFAATLAPASSVIPVITQTRAEHRMYLPLIALVAFVVALVAAATRAWANRGAKGAVLAGVLFAFGALTLIRNHDYRDASSIWRDTAQKRPQNERALFNEIIESGRATDASPADAERAIEVRLRELVAQHPDSPYLNSKLGERLAEGKAYDEALICFTIALQGPSPNPQYYAARSHIYLLQNQYELALDDINLAIHESRVPDKTLLNSKGVVLKKLGKLRESISQFDAALALEPKSVAALCNRGGALAELGKFRDAYRDLDQATELRPNNAEVRDSYAIALAADGRFELALKQANEAVRLAPKSASLLCRRGQIFTQLDRLKEAVADFDRAIELDAASSPAYEGRAVARFASQDFLGCLADLAAFERLGGSPPPEMVEEAKKGATAKAAAPDR
jgi:tetratricopeptide (TPR) repeat protein